MSSSRDALGRALVLGLSLVAFLAAGAWFVFERFGTAPSRPVPAVAVAPPLDSRPAPVVVPDVRATVVGVEGVVERTQGEGWVELRVGDALEPDDSVRTGPGARADLRMGDEASRLTLQEQSEVRMGVMSRTSHALRLERGLIDVDYRGQGDRVLHVQVESGTVAEAREARFTLLRRGTVVAVSTRGGMVNLSSAGATVQVGAGHRSVVLDGGKPLAAEPIPLDVLLEVAAKASAGKSLCLSLKGKVRVGTEVLVEGEPAEVSVDGSFQANVPRREGRSQVRVLAKEPGGATREMLLACRPPARAGPPREDSVKFHWRKP
ncbi:FecR domain-containing protein [Archangium violaceum]|uniref:FecR domain-containing protein n=1 Tax=Archangium violaceum TaxID=83451 RepID=UPI00194FEB70|nr:FecR domain-containing protein [Archangium violaceum]QRN93420.1 FecR domain-containing protein [Archangium violaceum]